MPVLLFFVLFNTVGIIPAVLAATAWSIKAAIGRRKRGLEIGWWLPTITIYLLARAAVTVAVERELVTSASVLKRCTSVLASSRSFWLA